MPLWSEIRNAFVEHLTILEQPENPRNHYEKCILQLKEAFHNPRENEQNPILDCPVCLQRYDTSNLKLEIEHPVVLHCGHHVGHHCWNALFRRSRSKNVSDKVRCPLCSVKTSRHSGCTHLLPWMGLTEENLSKHTEMQRKIWDDHVLRRRNCLDRADTEIPREVKVETRIRVKLPLISHPPEEEDYEGLEGLPDGRSRRV